MTAEEVNGLITLLLFAVYAILRFRMKPKRLNVTLQKHSLLVGVLMLVMCFILSWWVTGIIWVAIIFMNYRAYKIDRDFKDVIYQGYLYHGKSEFLTMMRQQFDFLDEVCDLEKLKKEFDDMDNTTISDSD